MTRRRRASCCRPARLAPGQRRRCGSSTSKADPELVYSSDELLLEAPNWAPDGAGLLLNGDGVLWRLDLEPAVALTPVPIEDLPPINNDHVVDAPRGLIYLSANDGHLYVAPIAGGTATRISHDSARYHYLHGVSPDGGTLAFVDLPRGDFSAAGRLALIPAAGGETTYPAAGSRHIDGPEYSPDGAWIYLNTEEFGDPPRPRPARPGPGRPAATSSSWSSPTPSTGSRTCHRTGAATYISFPTGTLGHPADLDVEIRRRRHQRLDHPAAARIPLFGGQGTLNVNSWSPDGHRFAYVAYPVADAVTGRASCRNSRPANERLESSRPPHRQSGGAHDRSVVLDPI